MRRRLVSLVPMITLSLKTTYDSLKVNRLALIDDGNKTTAGKNLLLVEPTGFFTAHHFLANLTYPSTHHPTVFTCQNNGNAIGEALSILMDVLPEYQFVSLNKLGRRNVERWLKQLPSGPNDLLVRSIQSKCAPIVEEWLQQSFQGKTVYISGEDVACPVLDERTYCLGPRYDGSLSFLHHFFRLRYLQLVHWYYIRHQGKLNNDAITNATFLFDFSRQSYHTKPHFLMYGNSNCVSYRDRAFDQLSYIDHVHHGGRCSGLQNKTQKERVQTGVKLKNWWDNTQVYSQYRFCLVMEHSKSLGYVTEKILVALQGGCIPIWYGTTEIFDVINRDAFVYYNISDPQPALEQIARLNGNSTFYNDLMKQPVLAHDLQTIEKYFSFSDDVGNGRLKAEIRSVLEMPPKQVQTVKGAHSRAS